MGEQNTYLNKAKSRKDDECYTRMNDIELEMKHYKRHFKNKVIYCNCDDPIESKFYQHFKQKFCAKGYGLKKLITTCYKSKDSTLFTDNSANQSVGRIFDGERERDIAPRRRRL